MLWTGMQNAAGMRDAAFLPLHSPARTEHLRLPGGAAGAESSQISNHADCQTCGLFSRECSCSTNNCERPSGKRPGGDAGSAGGAAGAFAANPPTFLA